MRYDEHEVVIAGGGPTGMMLAAELALAGVDVAVVERRPDHAVAGSRAGGFHARTIEVLDQRGVAERFIAEGEPVQVFSFGTAKLDMRDFPSRHPYTLSLFQREVERIMGEWLAELPVRVLFRNAVLGFGQDEDGVDVHLAAGEPLRAQYLVGCDGGRSLIRKAAGIGFPGHDATKSNIIAEVRMAQEPELGIRYDDRGIHGIGRLDDGIMRVVITERAVGPSTEPTLEDLGAALESVYGTDFGVHSPRWISRFTDATRQADAYRAGRVLLAGDAAHVHYPVGGQGLSLGVQDAVNLGWKLAQVVHGHAPETLLDTYHAERHPVGQRALEQTIVQSALQRRDPRTQAMVAVLSEIAAMDEPRRCLAGALSGLAIHYDLGDGHPLLGRRMPDLDLVTDAGPVRVFALMHDARALLLDLGELGAVELPPVVRRVDARYDGPWELPVLGAVSAPTAALVRPDGYVAWVGEGSADGLDEALRRWFGESCAYGQNAAAASA